MVRPQQCSRSHDEDILTLPLLFKSSLHLLNESLFEPITNLLSMPSYLFMQTCYRNVFINYVAILFQMRRLYSFKYGGNVITNVDPVVSRSEARVLTALTLDSSFASHLRHRCLSLVFLCCIIVCRYRPCEELITHPGRPTVRREIYYETKKRRPGPTEAVQSVVNELLRVLIR
jgi:hypothetical protein